jgi:S-(hydroxymethyl)glutathione dehydrogenase / alcohol dehydrogenase
MKAAILRDWGQPLTIEDVHVAKPGGREVLIRTVAAGVCHSDLHLADGIFRIVSLPVVLGHEAAGIVEQVGPDVRSVKPGDHVITCMSAFCGRCEACLTGHMARCPSGPFSGDNDRAKGEEPRLQFREGPPALHQAVLSSFAEYMLIPEQTCVAIRKDMPLDRAALIGCAVTTGVGSVINTAAVRPGETVAVIGCGGIGLSAINGAFIAGAGRIIAIDTQSAKLALAKEFGATDLVDATAGDPVAQVKELTGGGVHYSFEAVGMKVTAEQAFQMLRSGGAATIIGMIPPSEKLELRGVDFLDERRIQGSKMGSNRFPIDMPRFVDFYLQGRLHLDQLISRRIKLEQINDAFAELKRGELARSVIMFDA